MVKRQLATHVPDLQGQPAGGLKFLRHGAGKRRHARVDPAVCDRCSWLLLRLAGVVLCGRLARRCAAMAAARAFIGDVPKCTRGPRAILVPAIRRPLAISYGSSWAFYLRWRLSCGGPLAFRSGQFQVGPGQVRPAQVWPCSGWPRPGWPGQVGLSHGPGPRWADQVGLLQGWPSQALAPVRSAPVRSALVRVHLRSARPGWPIWSGWPQVGPAQVGPVRLALVRLAPGQGWPCSGSPRPGRPCSGWPGQVPGQVAGQVGPARSGLFAGINPT